MCKNKQNCECGCGIRTFEVHQSVRMRYETLDGRKYAVVPIVMARSTVVMNDGLLPESEMFAAGWNGRPVTVHHPSDGDGDFLSANTPATREKYTVGTLFNCVVEGGDLKGEAWIDPNKADLVFPGMLAAFEKGEAVDVSTGYFSTPDPSPGTIGGQAYSHVYRDIVPDHLALLPDQEGACSWADGCGVRANRKGTKLVSKFKDALATVAAHLTGNARGSDNDRRQQMADLISMDTSPFVPDDEIALGMLSSQTLQHFADVYCKPGEGNAKTKNEGEEDPAKKDEDPAANAEGDEEPPKDEKDPEAQDETKGGAKVQGNKGANGVDKNALSKEDKEALAFARGFHANAKAALVTKITANSKMTKESLADFSIAQLEVIANGLGVVAADYSGRGGDPVLETNTADDDAAAAAMTAHAGGIMGVINASKKGA